MARTQSIKGETIDELLDKSQKSAAENAFKSAIYNSFGVGFFIFAMVLCIFLIILLQAFVRPIVWALLMGACLFPLKKYLTLLTLDRLKSIETSESSITLMLSVFPFQMVDRTFDMLWNLFMKNIKNVAILIGIIVSIRLMNLFYEKIFVACLDSMLFIANVTKYFAQHVDNCWKITISLQVIYFVSIIFYNESIKTRFKLVFQVLSIPIWSTIVFLASKIMGAYRVTCLVIFFILICLGIVAYLKEFLDKVMLERKNDDSLDSSSDGDQEIKENLEKPTNKFVLTTLKNLLAKQRNKKNNQKNNSNKYFMILFWLIIVSKLWSGIYFVPIIIFAWKIVKYLSNLIVNFTKNNVNLERFIKEFHERQEFLTPKPFLVLIKLYLRGEQKINEWLQQTLDSLISIAIIVSLIGALCFGLVLISMQIHTESIQIISITNDLINENIVNYPYMEKVLPQNQGKVNDLVQMGIQNFNLYGRDFIASKLNTILSETADHELIEKQILDQWDALCKYLSQKALHGFEKILKNQTNSTLLRRQKSFELKSLWQIENFNKDFLMHILKDNFGIVVSVLDSLFALFRTNVNLLVTLIYTLTSLMFKGGFAILSFFISLIVFVTALFYLLSSSKQRYKPLQWMNDLSILSRDQNQTLSRTIEDSIRSVFVASFKMGVFYGLYTWLVHTLFDINIVYVPSLLAAFFGFLPIISTYWACIPGLLELWLLQKSSFNAFIFLLLHLAPTYLVDMAIYSDINYSHPYLTGLAVAGGIYCLGLEGALIGPIVLCLLMVIAKMNKELLILPKKAN